MSIKDFILVIFCLLSLNTILTDCASTITNADGDFLIGEKGKDITLKWNIFKFTEQFNVDFFYNNIEENSRLGGISNIFYNSSSSPQIIKRRISSQSCFFPNENGTCEITMSDLKYADSGLYFAAEYLGPRLQTSKSVSLDVKGGAELCGSKTLPQNFTCSPDHTITGNVTLCGMPKPNVTWYLEDEPIAGEPVDESLKDQHQYTYSFQLKIESKMCGREISYKAEAFKNITGSSTILIEDFDVSDVVLQETSGFPILTWEAGEHGRCNVYMVVSFNQSGNSTDEIKVPVSNETFTDSAYTLNSTGLTYRTIVYWNGIQVSVNKESKYLPLTRTTTTTTPTTTTTTTAAPTTTSTTKTTTASTTSNPTETTTTVSSTTSTTSNTTNSSSQNKGDDDVNVGLIAGAAAAGFVFLVLLVVFVIYCKKMKKAEKPSSVPMRPLTTGVSVDDERYVEGLYDQVDKKPSKRPPPEEIEKMYAQPIKNNKGGKQAAQNSEYDVALGHADLEEGQTANSPEELASMYAQVQKDRPPPSIYSELGPGGGRDGPKPVIKPSEYADAKDLTGDYSDINEMQARMNGGGAGVGPSDYDSVSDHLGKVNGGMDHDI